MSKRTKFKVGDTVAFRDPRDVALHHKKQMRHVHHTATVTEVHDDLVFLDRELFADPSHVANAAPSAFAEDLKKVAPGFTHPAAVREEVAAGRRVWGQVQYRQTAEQKAAKDWPEEVAAAVAA